MFAQAGPSGHEEGVMMGSLQGQASSPCLLRRGRVQGCSSGCSRERRQEHCPASGVSSRKHTHGLIYICNT